MASTQIAPPGAIVVDAQRLEKLEMFLATKGPVEIKVERSDSLNLTGQSLDAVKIHPNAPPREIDAITLTATAPDRSWVVSVELSRRWLRVRPPFSASILGPEAELLHFRAGLLDLAAEMRPWWDRFARLEVAGLTLFLLGGLVLYANVAVVLGWFGHDSSASSKSDGALGVVFIFGVMSIATLLDHVRARIFPRCVFAIGKGVEMHQLLEKVRYAIVVSGGVAAIAALARSAWHVLMP